MTERELQRCVLQLARLLGWRVYHTYDSRRSQPGFPDLVLCRGRRLLFRELKSDRGRMRPEQRDWLHSLQMTWANAGVWAPEDWRSGRIEAELRGQEG